MNKIGKKQLVWGEVVLDRLEGSRRSKRVRRAAENFRRAHAGYLRAVEKVTACKADIRSAGRAVHAADAALDDAILELANRLVGAQLGPRRNPFESFSPHPPSRLTELGYAAELQAVRKLADRITQSRPPLGVRRGIRRCLELADAVDRALRETSRPRARYRKALADLETHIALWREAFQRLRVEATAYWIDDRATFAAVFAPPEAIQQPRRRKRARKEPRPRPLGVKRTVELRFDASSDAR